MAERIVSDILMKTTIFHPTTNVFVSTALLRVLGLKYRADDGNVTPSYTLTGSSADLNIKPLLSCVDDIDIMFRTDRDVVIPESYDIPKDNFIKSLSKRVTLFRMQPSSYSGYINLLEVGSLEWDETSNEYFFSRQDKGLLTDESQYSTDYLCVYLFV